MYKYLTDHMWSVRGWPKGTCMYHLYGLLKSYGLERGTCRYVKIKRIEHTERSLTQNQRLLNLKTLN
jgi:hypothetical protein